MNKVDLMAIQQKLLNEGDFASHKILFNSFEHLYNVKENGDLEPSGKFMLFANSMYRGNLTLKVSGCDILETYPEHQPKTEIYGHHPNFPIGISVPWKQIQLPEIYNILSQDAAEELMKAGWVYLLGNLVTLRMMPLNNSDWDQFYYTITHSHRQMYKKLNLNIDPFMYYSSWHTNLYYSRQRPEQPIKCLLNWNNSSDCFQHFKELWFENYEQFENAC